MKRTYEDSLRDILTAAELALQFVEGLEFEDFQDNVEKQYAVTRAFEVIGEAARNVPAEIRAMYPQLPWSEMIGMRNVLIHDYVGVDEAVIWRTIQDDLPSLCESVRGILAEFTG
ncbi:MAG: DUF86 domain-containing protein [Chloroflexi bacterium]|nr:DUF86 domain-containing protein [Chloroflexota bacterium]